MTIPIPSPRLPRAERWGRLHPGVTGGSVDPPPGQEPEDRSGGQPEWPRQRADWIGEEVGIKERAFPAWTALFALSGSWLRGEPSDGSEVGSLAGSTR